MNFRFSKRMRLLRPAEFARVMAARTSCADGMLRVYAAANDLDHPRLGLTVSRKVGGAVERTRWKRALREAFRLVQHELPALDLVCLPHRTSEPDGQRLRESLVKLSRQLAPRLASRGRRSEA
jgi:ribonuclease P protein component